VKDEVEGPADLDVLGDVMVEEDEVGAADVLDVLERCRLEVVHADDTMSLSEQIFAEVGA
jgi:hypothetical protein